ncbi:metal-dependent transcriptional regulator [Spirochaeta africana]|nr:metal-dependent transcriptional regulator [Spirochaeta africana]
MHQSHELSESQEMYLKTIFLLLQRYQAARVKDIADELEVNKPSVTAALRNLAGLELVNYKPYGTVSLTDRGVTTAREIIAKYRTLKDFFTKVLGVEETEAESEACHMEHRISGKVFDRLMAFVEYYETCPHEKVRWNSRLERFCAQSDQDCQRCSTATPVVPLQFPAGAPDTPKS